MTNELTKLQAQLDSKTLSWEETKKVRKQIEALLKKAKKPLPPNQPSLL